MNHPVHLCEKPKQAQAVASVLGVIKTHEGWIETKAGPVTWAYGHLVGLFEPEDYDLEYKSWQKPLPFIPPEFKLRAKDAKAQAQLKVIKGLLVGCVRVVLCTDPDREGEMIGREILRHLRYKGPVERAWFTALTQAAIMRAFASLLPGAQTEPLYWAAMGRSQADWLVGMNLTRAASRKLAARGTVLSIGRVQTPTLAVIVRREREIRAFTAQDYFEVDAEVDAADGTRLTLRHAPTGEARIFDKAAAQALADSVPGAVAALSVKEEAKTTAPPLFHSLLTLQKDADRLLGWDSEKTLAVAQALYDQHKVLTYPRSDCAVLPDEFSADAPALLSMLARLPEVAAVAAKAKAAPVLRMKGHYDSSSLGSHHAIVPTGVDPTTVALSSDERDLFVIVAKRFIAAHLPDYEYLATTITWTPAAAEFSAHGCVPTLKGWREAFSDGSADDPDRKSGEAEADDEAASGKAPPKVADGTTGTGRKAAVEAKVTRPPQRFSESTLLDAMENIGRYVTDPAAKSRLKKTSGIGTPSTRSNILATLRRRGYVSISKRKYTPSEGAMAFIETLEATIPDWADPGTTALWEDDLEGIAKGTGHVGPFVDSVVAKLRTGVAALDALVVKPGDLLDLYSGKTSKSSGAFKGRSGKPTPSTSAPRAPVAPSGAPGRTDLKVKYDDREKAKSLGARWDADKKVWYVPPGVALDAFRKGGFVK